MTWWLELAGFAARVGVIVVGFGTCVGFLALALRRGVDGGDERLTVDVLNSVLERDAEALRERRESRSERRARIKARRATVEAFADRPTLYVVDFEGDITASAVEGLRDVVSAVLRAAGDSDHVVLRLESAGGQVHSYGLAASQLDRLRAAGIRLTVCVDRVAASGGYLMACVSEHVVAAPFAIVGSIGVVAEFPNVHRLLRDHGVDYLELTAGEHKRSLTPLGEITEEKRARMEAQLHATHRLFRDHVAARRPALDIEAVATGEYWYGTEALALGLVDELATSDDVVARHVDTHRVIAVGVAADGGWRDRLPWPLGRGHGIRATLPMGM